uniref:Uncharacterized protein n=1 Tax=viral metagenome TaxID=1070528 RepID=A0A6C0BDN5_9ZZZZ
MDKNHNDLIFSGQIHHPHLKDHITEIKILKTDFIYHLIHEEKNH